MTFDFGHNDAHEMRVLVAEIGSALCLATSGFCVFCRSPERVLNVNCRTSGRCAHGKDTVGSYGEKTKCFQKL